MTSVINISDEKCIGCGICARDCLSRIITIRNKKAVIDDMTGCIFCGHCGAVCPVNAIDFVEDGYRDEILEFEDFENVAYEELKQMILMKRSIRQYKDKAVGAEKIDKIIEIGRVSPTGGNRQPLSFTVVNNAEKIEELKLLAMKTLYDHSHEYQGRYRDVFAGMLENYENDGYDRLFYNAPSLIVTHGNPKASTSLNLDAGIAGGQMTLIAESLGLGSCFIGYLKFAAGLNDDISKFLDIPASNRIAASMILGYKDVDYLRTVPRKKVTVNYL